MYSAYNRDDWKWRRAELASIGRHTLTFDPGNGSRLVAYSPHSIVKPRDSFRDAWRDTRQVVPPQANAAYDLLTMHPWCRRKWVFLAFDCVTSGMSGGESPQNVITHAQTIVWLKLHKGQQCLQSALAKPLEVFPAWVTVLFLHSCQETCRDFTGRALKSVHFAQLSIIAWEQLGGEEDPAADVAFDELWRMVEECAGDFPQLPELLLEGLTQKDIAAKLGLGDDQVRRLLAKMRERLGRKLRGTG
jgi:hypothetical protein